MLDIYVPYKLYMIYPNCACEHPSQNAWNRYIILLFILTSNGYHYNRKHPKINRKNIEDIKKMIDRLLSNTDHQSVLKVEEMKLKLNHLMLQNDIY